MDRTPQTLLEAVTFFAKRDERPKPSKKKRQRPGAAGS
jgi:hypothetical protein